MKFSGSNGRGTVAQSYPSTTGANGVWTVVGGAYVAGSSGSKLQVTAYAYCA